MVNNTAKGFDILAISLITYLCNYFDNPTKLFSNLYLTKFLDTLAKLLLKLFLNIT